MRSLEHRYPFGVVVVLAVLTGCPLRGHAAPPQPLQALAAGFGISTGSAGAPTLWKIPLDITYTDNGPAPANVGDAVALYQPYLDQFSWRMFIALNWPSLPTGKANQNRWLGAEGDGPTVWEHWMNSEDLFRKGGEPPPPWGTPPPIPPECRGMKLKDIFAPVVFSQDDDSFTTHNDPTATNKGSAYIQAGQTGPLVDQTGRWTRFEIYVNEGFYDYVTRNKLYSREGQQK
ncbi:MAG TPA: hypothetical protein VND93_19550, partial [Myxococcales bacterium]|nr:hypothetical protein [Myxococcales bacterium]